MGDLAACCIGILEGPTVTLYVQLAWDGCFGGLLRFGATTPVGEGLELNPGVVRFTA